MVVVLSLIEAMTLNFTVYDSHTMIVNQSFLLEGEGLSLENKSDASGFVQFSSDKLEDGTNYTLKRKSDIFEDEIVIVTATQNRSQTIEFKLENSTTKIDEKAKHMTLRFTIYDASFNQTHAVQLVLQAEDGKILKSSNKNGVAEFSAQFVPGKEYALQVISKIFSEKFVNFIAQPSLELAVSLHPYLPLKVNLLHKNSKSIKGSSVDVFCKKINASSAKFNDNGVAIIFIQEQYHECLNTSISYYGLFIHNPTRIFQEKLYQVKVDVDVYIKPDQLFSIKLQYVEKPVKLYNGNDPEIHPIANLEVKLMLNGSNFFVAKTNESGEILFESIELEKFPQNQWIHAESSKDETHFVSNNIFNVVYNRQKDYIFQVKTIKLINMTFNLCHENTSSQIIISRQNKEVLRQSGSCQIKISKNETVFVVGETYKLNAITKGQFTVTQEFEVESETVINVKWGLSIGGTIGVIVGLFIVMVAIVTWLIIIRRNKKQTKQNVIRQSEKQSLIGQDTLL